MSDAQADEKETLPPAVKADWLAALRSGEYTQTTGQLRRGCSHCCLGVLGEVCQIDFDSDNGYLWGDDGEEGQLISMDTQDTLANMNDGGVSFGAIADWIEEHL